MTRLALAAALATILWVGNAEANGRFPATVNTRFQPAQDELILLPSTFGLLLSNDGGESFRWVCEDGIGYGGTYDPDYAVSATGRIYATTFSGLRYSDDTACSWNDVGAPLASPAFVAEVEIGADGRVWASTATGAMPNDVYVSTDGVTFVSAGLEDPDTWWRSIRIAPSDPDVIYVSGMRVVTSGGSTTSTPRLAVSINGGQSWTEQPITDFAFGSSPDLFIEGVLPATPMTAFARVRGARQPVGDDLYRTTDGGATWAKVLEMGDTITAFTIRSDNQTVIAGTVNLCTGDPTSQPKGCVRMSTTQGAPDSFVAPAYEPRMGCINERADGELFACGANWEPDMFALGRSDDAMSWSTVMRFSDLSGPLECPSGTPQNDCAALVWPSLCIQLGICGADDPDAGTGAPPINSDDGFWGGCCNTSSRAADAPLALLVLGLGMLPFWRRRRR